MLAAWRLANGTTVRRFEIWLKGLMEFGRTSLRRERAMCSLPNLLARVRKIITERGNNPLSFLPNLVLCYYGDNRFLIKLLCHQCSG
jgi:hypothetical protein